MTDHTINSVLSEMRALQARAAQGLEQAQPQTTGEIDKSTGSFSDMMQQAIDQVNQSQQHSAGLARALETGDPNVDIAEVMVAMQKSSVSFQALTEVRNKLLTAYQDVMNMPV